MCLSCYTGCMKELPLSRGLRALIDDDDFEKVKNFKWWVACPGGKFYAASRIGQGWKAPIVYLHRFLMNPIKKQTVDHIDSNGLNCQRKNMRFATRQQNLQSVSTRKLGCGKFTSKYKGVYYDKQKTTKPWRSRVSSGFIGSYDTEIEAARAYDREAKRQFKEFAKLNFSTQ